MATSLDHNPFGAALAEATTAHEGAQTVVGSLAADLAWLDGISVDAMQAQLTEARASHARLSEAIRGDEEARRALPPLPTGSLGFRLTTVGLGMIASVIPGAAVGAAWSMARNRRRRENDPNVAEHHRLSAAIASAERQREAAASTVTACEAALARYSSLDRDDLVGRLGIARVAAEVAEAKSVEIRRHHGRAEARLAPLVAELRTEEAKAAGLRADLAEAATYQERLSAAPTSGARGPIHGAITKRFGVGSLGEVITPRRAELERTERTIAKLRERIAIAAADAARAIDHIVVDASNLCWHGAGRQQAFVGLAALDALVPLLAARYRLTLIFDGSVQRKLRFSRAALQQRFGAGVEVAATAASRKADATFLNYAAGPTAYVLTNDQLRDFGDHPVVRERRVLRYHQLQRMVEIPALDLVAHFEPAGRERTAGSPPNARPAS